MVIHTNMPIGERYGRICRNPPLLRGEPVSALLEIPVKERVDKGESQRLVIFRPFPASSLLFLTLKPFLSSQAFSH